MDNWEANGGRYTLERIVALLFALANLAELAVGASFLRRRRVLGMVSYGEAEARAFVIGMACGEAVEADALETTCDAELLAIRLRALALMLCVLLAPTGRVALSGAAGPHTGRRSHRIFKLAVRRLATPTPDTS